VSLDPLTTSHDPGAPLAGRSVVVTRTAEQSRALAAPLEKLGATVIAFPVIATVEPLDWSAADAAITRLSDYDWVVLTSANAVRCFLDRIGHAGLEAVRELSRTKVAVVGSATAGALAERGVEANLVPADFRAEGLVEEFAGLGVGAGARVLVPRALEAREVLPDALRGQGATVDVVPVYRTVQAEPDLAVIELFSAGEVDAVTFTSPSTFRHFRELLAAGGLDADAVLRGLDIASIGPVTSDAVRAAGHDVAVEPAEYTVAGLVSALVERYGSIGTFDSSTPA
jgi:uroporphyrinogen III methyltransferase/synthase